VYAHAELSTIAGELSKLNWQQYGTVTRLSHLLSIMKFVLRWQRKVWLSYGIDAGDQWRSSMYDEWWSQGLYYI